MDDWGSPWADDTTENPPASSTTNATSTAPSTAAEQGLGGPPHHGRRGSEGASNGAGIQPPGSGGRHVKSQSVWDVPDFADGDVWAAPAEKTPGLPVPEVTGLEESVWTPGVRVEEPEDKKAARVVEDDGWGAGLPPVDSLEAERNAWNTISPGISPGLPVPEPASIDAKVESLNETEPSETLARDKLDNTPPALPRAPSEEAVAITEKATVEEAKQQKEDVEEKREAPVPDEEKDKKFDSVQVEQKQEEPEGGDEFDDFGEFEDASEAQPDVTATIPAVLPAGGLENEKKGLFKPDTSLLKNLYPMFSDYPTPPAPPSELIDSTETRKAWYRLTRKESLREHNSASDDYVRISWADSSIRTEATNLVSKWASEDTRNGNTISSTRIGLGSSGAEMFGWGSGGDKIAKIASLDSVMPTKKKRRERKVVEQPKASFGWDVAEFDPLAAQRAAEAKAAAATKALGEVKEKAKSIPAAISIPKLPVIASTSKPTQEEKGIATPKPAAESAIAANDDWGMFEEPKPTPTAPAPSSQPKAAEPAVFDDWGFFEGSKPGTTLDVVPQTDPTPSLEAIQTAKADNDEWGTFEEVNPAPAPAPAPPTSAALISKVQAPVDDWGFFEDSKPASTQAPLPQQEAQKDDWGLFEDKKVEEKTADDKKVVNGPAIEDDDEWGTFEGGSPAPSVTSSVKPFPLQPTVHAVSSPITTTEFDAFESFVESRPSSRVASHTSSLPVSTAATPSNGLKQDDLAMFDSFMSSSSKPAPLAQQATEAHSRSASRASSLALSRPPSRLANVQTIPQSQGPAQRFTEQPKSRPASFTPNDFDAFESMVSPSKRAPRTPSRTPSKKEGPNSTRSSPAVKHVAPLPHSVFEAPLKPAPRPNSVINATTKMHSPRSSLDRSFGVSGSTPPMKLQPHRTDAFKPSNHTRTSSPLSQPSRTISMNEIAKLDIAKANAALAPQPPTQAEDDDEGWGDFETVVQSPASVTTAPMAFPTMPTTTPPQTQQAPTMSSFAPLVPQSTGPKSAMQAPKQNPMNGTTMAPLTPTSRPSSVIGFSNSTVSPVQRPQSVSYSSFQFPASASTAPPTATPFPHISSQLSSSAMASLVTNHTKSPSLPQFSTPAAPPVNNDIAADDDFGDFGDFVSKPAKSPGAVASPLPTAWGSFDILQPSKPASTPPIAQATSSGAVLPPTKPSALPSNSFSMEPLQPPSSSSVNPSIPASMSSLLQLSKAAQSATTPTSDPFAILQPTKPAVPTTTSSIPSSTSSFHFTDFTTLSTPPAPPASVPPLAPAPISTPTPTPRPPPPSRPMSLPPQSFSNTNANPYSELNFFDVPAPKPTMGMALPPSVTSNGVGKRESEEDKAVRRVLEGLPDWGRLIGK